MSSSVSRCTRSPSLIETGRIGISATLTTTSGWPDSTAASTATSTASGSNGTSNVASITGRVPETAGVADVVPRASGRDHDLYSGRSFQRVVLSRIRAAARRRSCGTTSSV